MLPAGTESWSLRLAGGADLASADTRLAAVHATGRDGQVRLADLHYQQDLSGGRLGESPIFSVIRTGKGDLDILSGGDFRQTSFYGIYTAGTQSAPCGITMATPSQCPGAGRLQPEAGQRSGPVPGEWPRVRPGRGVGRYEPLVTGGQYAAWYPEQGGNVYRRAGQYACRHRGIASGPELSDKRGSGWMSGGYTGTWLWRQGGEDLGQRTAWWINFGTYVPTAFYSSVRQPGVTIEASPALARWAAAMWMSRWAAMRGSRESPAAHPPSVSLIATAWCWRWEARTDHAGRRPRHDGRGDLSLKVNGALNPVATSSYDAAGAVNGGVTSDMNGVLTNLRGALDVSARSIGRVDPMRMVLDPSDSRPMNTDSPTLGLPSGHSHCAGDATARLSTNSDLVLGGVGDAGRNRPLGGTRLISGGTEIGGGAQSWFSLWTDRTSIDLHAAGGSLTPISTQHVDGTNAFPLMFNSGLMGDSFSIRPASVRSHRPAASTTLPEGYGRRGVDLRAGFQRPGGTVRRPFAQRRRHADRNVGRGPAVMPTPERPAYLVEWNVGGSAIRKTNAIAPPGALFAFGLDTAAGRAPQSDAGIARYYAGMDIVGLQTGSLVTSIDGNQYRAARPAWIQAGRDIVNLKGLILNQRPNDVSRIAAGRDILYANVDIAGPGWLEIIAGRNLTQEDRGRLGSVGLIDGKPATGKAAPASSSASAARATTPPSPGAISTPATRRPRPDPGQPAGKAIKTYERELTDWLRALQGYDGPADQARASSTRCRRSSSASSCARSITPS